jgi:hypothetical protein
MLQRRPPGHFSSGEYPMYRISRDGHEPIVDVDQIEAIEPALWSKPMAHYHIDEIAADPLSSGHSSGRWSVGIKRMDGSIVIEPDSWKA